MVTFFKNIITLALLALVLVSSNAFAGQGGGQPRPCAHQYRECLKNCIQQKKDADQARRDCVAAAYQNNAAGSQALKDALAACRSAYNQAMQGVAACRAECKRQYDQCMNGGYEG